ncbi:MAG: restriction endonuclease [Candidatus Nitrosocosmicus sp.]|nr:restriction endonuclease [Candidatus Nitrosocosmicus sp.]
MHDIVSIAIGKEIGLRCSIWNLLVLNKVLIYEFLIDPNRFKSLFRDKQSFEELKNNDSLNVFTNKSDIHQILEHFVDLEYVERRVENIYSVDYEILLFPYIPIISPIGFTTFTGEILNFSDTVILTEKELRRFKKVAEEIRSQTKNGIHPHLRQFDFAVNIETNSEVYEMKNTYFDAFMFGQEKGQIRLYETTPLNIPDINGLETKKWAYSKFHPPELLNDKTAIDKIISCVEWKSRYHGLLVSHSKAHWILDEDVAENYHDKITKTALKIGDLFERTNVDYHNMHSRIFEDSVSLQLSKLGYSVETRRKIEDISNNKKFEIDIWGNKDQKILLAECKLRFGSNPINKDEVQSLIDKIQLVITQHHSSVIGYIITNINNIDEDAIQLARSESIKIFNAVLSREWKNRADWKIITMKEVLI